MATKRARGRQGAHTGTAGDAGSPGALSSLLARHHEVSGERLAPEVEEYFTQGAAESVSAAEAESAWRDIRFLPRVLQDVTEVETSTSLLGTPVSTPLGIAPTTLHRAADPEGEVAMARAAKAAGALMVVSTNAGSSFEDIAATGVDWWLQAYVTADRSWIDPVLERAVEAGARAVVLTADTPVVSTKVHRGASVWDVVDPAWRAHNHPQPSADDPAGSEKARDLGPHDIAWLAGRFGLPVVVKGVLNPLDVRRCLDAGAAAIWVSNHGGRQLDRAVDTVHALTAIAENVGEEAELYVDGGLRDPLGLIAARCLGARAAFWGRPPLWALAAGGSAAVQELYAAIHRELVEAMRLIGCATYTELNGSYLASR